MPLSLWSLSVILTLKLIYYAYFHSIIKYGIFGVILSTVGRFSLRKRKSSELWLVHIPRTSCSSLFKQLQIPFVPCQYILLLMNLVINNQEIFQMFIYSQYKEFVSSSEAKCQPIFFSKMYILCWHTCFQQFATQCDNPQE